MITTWSPQSTWGVKLGLCLPRRMLATIEASRPTTSPSASIRCHFFSTSRGFAERVVFISAFIGFRPLEMDDAALSGPRDGGQMAEEGRKVKEKRAFRER